MKIDTPTPFSVLDNIRRRAAESVIGQAGLKHPALTRMIREKFAQRDAREGWAIVPDPLVEAAHPFETAQTTMQELSGNLLWPALVDALDGAGDTRTRHYRFLRTWKPFAHQIQSWELLTAKDPASVLVTSGTGSGKTECFLVPILNDLARQAEKARGPLEGVQAIALYPLNALIASQEERLREWTAPFGGKMRFALYNGALPETMKASEVRAKGRPEQVLDRTALRASPPPLLVTNITMLEYMLARRKDAPILEKSRGSLKWIVLDEAHTHVGAAAAELALLLRRVLLAFDVKPQDVRFVATSATIGAGAAVERDLRRFLSDVSGFPEDRVQIVAGNRRRPLLPAETRLRLDPSALSDAASATDATADEQAFDLLAGLTPVQDLVRRFSQSEALPWSALAATARDLDVPVEPFAMALARARKGEEALAPLRIHAFHRALPGLWSCLNPACPKKPGADWSFGAVFPAQTEICPHCSSCVLEIVGCTSCGEPFLEGEERAGHLRATSRFIPKDEFADDPEREGGTGDDDEDEDQQAAQDVPEIKRIFAERRLEGARTLWLKVGSDRVLDRAEDDAFPVHTHDPGLPPSCPACGESESNGRGKIRRPYRFGAPFLLRIATPILLEGIAPDEANPTAPAALPAGGRRLLSFTDSRQGTARLSAKLETDSERDFVRSFIYHKVQQASAGPVGEERKALLKQAQGLEQAIAASPALGPTLATLLQEIQTKLTGKWGIKFDDLVSGLAQRDEVAVWMKAVWAPRGEDQLFEDEQRLARFLLLREFDRRPRKANSVETLGLARLTFDAIDGVSAAPASFRDRGLDAADWRAFLSTIVTHFVRSRSATRVDPGFRRWMQREARARHIVAPGLQSASLYEIQFPNRDSGRRHRVIALLQDAFSIDPSSRSDRDLIEDVLSSAWKGLGSILPGTTGHDHQLDFTRASVSALEDAWLCPVTDRVLDVAFRGLSPYQRSSGVHMKATPIKMPRHPDPFIQGVDGHPAVQAWLDENPGLSSLRQMGLWSGISDRVSLFAPFAKSVEHSAQQPAQRLRRYEDAFKKGEINILNCSTTMEMGVDIGSVSTVMMTNVPPSIASYRQRVGRAGRRGQPTALAFTLCKDRPLDRETFRDPAAFLRRGLAAPRVALDSRPIVQRQVNAYLLARFLAEHDAEGLRTTAGAFFGRSAQTGVPNDPHSPAKQFLGRLRDDVAFRDAHAAAVATIVRNSILEGDGGIWISAADKLKAVSEVFCEEADRLMVQRGPGKEPADKRVHFVLVRLLDDFLFGALADRGFLPGHGFPRDVLSFVHATPRRNDASGGERENRFESRDFPQRAAEIAIRDYAPGSETVIDGLVYKSAGVTLNWKRPADEQAVREVQSLRHVVACRNCQTIDVVSSLTQGGCPACGSPDISALQFLKPGGFASDVAEKPHADVQEVAFVSPEDVRASVRGVAWKPFIENGLARMRASREGLVYYANLGPHRHGFAICLDCGRAAAETASPAIGGPAPDELIDHKPLRGRGDERTRHCLGNDRSFAVQRWLALGHDQTTDVFEFEPAGLGERSAALAFASALREALARRLGIEPDEMGIAVEQRRSPLGARTHAVFLFDRASGGAGFSIQAEQRLGEILPEIETILGCPVIGCARACSACVLTRDTSDEADPPDRIPALAFVQDLRRSIQTPDAADAFASGSRFSFGALHEIVSSALDGRAPRTVTLFTYDRFDIGLFAGSPLEATLRILAQREVSIRLILPPGCTAEMDDAQRLALRDLSNRSGLTLHEGAAKPFNNKALAMASVSTAATQRVWACRDAAASIPGPHWGIGSDAPVVNADTGIELDCTAVPDSHLRPAPGHRYAEIADELDGDFRKFGDGLAKLILGELSKAGVRTDVSPISISYEDRYLCAPLQVRLLYELTAALFGRPKAGSKLPLTIRTQPCRRDGPSSGYMSSDWRDDELRRQAAILAATPFGLAVDWSSTGSVGHARVMRLDYGPSASAKIVFDQGLGAWRTAVPVRFSHFASADIQAQDLTGKNALVAKYGIGRTYIVAGPAGSRDA